MDLCRVAGCRLWAVYFANAGKETSIAPLACVLAYVTQPAAAAVALHARRPVSLAAFVAMNAATHALAGLIAGKLYVKR